MSKQFFILHLLGGVLFLFTACEKLSSNAPNPDTVMNAPIDGMSEAQYKTFNKGAGEFDEVYFSENGLGPVFVSNSCASCHSQDNRGTMATILTRFGQTDASGNQFLNKGGPQLQQFALPGYQAESIPAGATSSQFIAPIVAGVGFLELVSDKDILDMADPHDADGDGISGVPNWNAIPDWVTPNTNAIVSNGKYICRFGRKGSTYNIHQQTATAFNQDMGVTTSFILTNPQNPNDPTNTINSNDPEVTDNNLNNLIFYLQTLQAPIQRNQTDATVQKGKSVFITIGCEKCHKESLKTGYSPVNVLSNKVFHPYTDLLLHDMGNQLDDHYTEGNALTSEWKTPPLWGLGLTPNAQGGQYFLMHDGRARSIEEAILLHEGEATRSTTNYKKLNNQDRESLITFLKSL